MRRVLIVSPHFPPINAPDHQRVRMSLPHFAEFGWEPTVLTVSADWVEAEPDAWLARTVPEEIQVIRTQALSIKGTGTFGVGNLALRALPFLRKAGNEILRKEQFDLVYFSTTMFPVMALGPRWQRRYRIPYVLDFQDPWLSNYSNGHGTPPGGRLKYGLSQRLAKMLEPRTVKNASHIISVSPAYPEMLKRRYRFLQHGALTVLPFGVSERDFEFVRSAEIKQRYFDPSDGRQHWVYVGRGGRDMELAARSFFEALRQARESNSSLWRNVVVHFIGTDYAPKGRGRKSIEPLAAGFSLAGVVEETTNRIPYFEALRCLIDADALLVLGSDDPGYTPSKLFPCIMAKKPLLLVAHKQSSAGEVLRETHAGTLVSFETGESSSEIARRISSSWFSSRPAIPQTLWSAFEPYTAREMTRRQCEVFDRVCLNGQ